MGVLRRVLKKSKEGGPQSKILRGASVLGYEHRTRRCCPEEGYLIRKVLKPILPIDIGRGWYPKLHLSSRAGNARALHQRKAVDPC